MKLVVISASMRKESQSLKVSKWLAEHAQSLDVESEVLDLHEVKLPLFDTGETPAPNAEKILNILDSADGLVFVSPEWNGMMSHGLANMLHFVGKELAHKPVMLVGVSAGRGGTYPVAQMRQIGQKNNQYVISPESLIVQGVNDIMNDHEMSDEKSPDQSVKTRADYALKVLIEYAKSLKTVRESGVIDHESFANGV
jgi:azobenzene reductase